MKPFNYYQELLCKNGFDILQISHGSKACFDKGWPTKDYCQIKTSGFYKKLISNIGIKTQNTPAVDVDVTDSDIAREITQEVSKLLSGNILYRTGRAPKVLIPCQLKGKSFSKVTTGKWEGHCVEILSAGQQYVAFGEHPDTKKPYSWDSESLLDVPKNKLPKLDAKLASQIIELSCEIFENHGLEQTTKANTAKNKKPHAKTKKLPRNDPALKKLKKLGLIKQERERGKFELTECPFCNNHTVTHGNWKGGAFYSQVGVNGYDMPFFYCCHSGCVEMKWRHLRLWLGITLLEVAEIRKEVFK